MRILVTGGAGFIGSQIVDTYIEAGHEVVVIDNLSTGRKEYINPKAKFYKIDIRSSELEEVFRIEHPDIVNHHAAQKSIQSSIKNPREDAEINIIGLLNLLNCSIKSNVKKFIFASSGGALSESSGVEKTPEITHPLIYSPYAASKYLGEIYLSIYHEIHNLNYLILRYSNVYGPRQNMDGECGVVPIFLNNLLENKSSKLFNYSDMPEGATRDYIYVKDVCKANILGLEKGNSITINIGSGEETHTADLYYLLEKITNKKLPLISVISGKGELKRSVLKIETAFNVLEWRPETKLDLGLYETLQYTLNLNERIKI